MVSKQSSVLILGGSGFLGPHLARAFAPDVVVPTFLRNPVAGGRCFDVQRSTIAALIEGLSPRPSAAVILLGITNIDACARDPAGSAQVNVEGIVRIIDELRALQIMPVFASTDGVFDGSRGGWREDDVPQPILTYGRQKVAVENHLASMPSPWLVVRLPKLLAPRRHPRCMLTGWIDALGRDESILCATDQYFAPACDEDVARAIALLVRDSAHGLWHLGGPQRLSRRNLLEHVLQEYRRHARVKARIVECRLQDVPVLERRPLDTSLDSSRFAARFGARFRDVASITSVAVRGCLGVP